jgi:hypothetical protein
MSETSKIDRVKKELKASIDRSGNIRIDEGEGIAGNQRGMDRWMQFDEMSKDIDRMKKTLEKHSIQLRQMRAGVLEDAASAFTGAARIERNRIVHGGDVEMDLEVVRFVQLNEPDRYHNVCAGFRAFYRISVTAYQNELEAAPQTIVKTLNRLADLRHLDIWRRDDRNDAKLVLIQLCNSIVDSWKNSPSSFPTPQDSEDLKAVDDEWQRASELR